MSDIDEIPIDELVIRHQKPKKSKEKMKFRHYYKGNGFLSKVLVYEDKWEDYYEGVNNKKQKKFAAKTFENNGDFTSTGVIYSQGKKKGWETKKEILNSSVPEPAEGVNSVSVIHFKRPRAAMFYPSWVYTDANKANFREWYHDATMNSVAMKTKEGEETKRKGKIHPKVHTQPKNSEHEPRLHVEYQVLDFINSPRMNNMSKYTPYRSLWNLATNSGTGIEGCKLDKDVVRDAEGIWWTGDRERPNGIRRDLSFADFSDSETSSDESGGPRPSGFTLSDFMPIELPSKMKKKDTVRPRALSESWDWVPSYGSAEKTDETGF